MPRDRVGKDLGEAPGKDDKARQKRNRAGKKRARGSEADTANTGKSGKHSAIVGGAEGNFVNIDDSAEIRLSSINIRVGKHNTIAIGKGAKVTKTEIVIRGNGNRLILGDECEFTGRILIKGDNQTVSLGYRTTTVDVYVLCSEGCDVIIGDHCMFSRKIEIRTSDAHSLIDKQSGNRINLPKSISIGNHVWVGVGVIINKGAAVADDCIVGASSFLNKAFTEESVVLAGSPAKIVKTNVSWNRTRKAHFRPREIEFWKKTAVDAGPADPVEDAGE